METLVTDPKYTTTYARYGVQCGPGWAKLVEPLLKLCEVYGVEVLQVKEKFGTLRFYYANDREDRLSHLVAAAEEASGHTCEDCGENGYDLDASKPDPTSILPSPWSRVPKATTGPSRTSHWIRTLCAPCREKWDASREPKA